MTCRRQLPCLPPFAYRGLRLLFWLPLILAALLACAAARAADPWLWPDSDLRLRVMPESRTAHSLRVDIPPALRDQYQGAVVFDGSAKRLPFTPIVAGKRLLAVELPLAPAQLARLGTPTYFRSVAARRRRGTSPLDLQIYLLPQPAAGPATPARAPVRLFQRPVRIVARPSSCREFRYYAGKAPPLVLRQEISRFDAVSQAELAPYLEKRGVEKRRLEKRGLQTRGQVHYRLETSLLVEEAGAVQFAVKAPRGGAWFIFLDYQDVSSWGETGVVDKQGLLVADPVERGPGLHLLHFSAIVGAGETLPQLLYRPPGGRQPWRPLEPRQMFSANIARNLRVEAKDDVLVPGFHLSFRAAYALEGTSTMLGLAQVYDLSNSLFGRQIAARQLSIDGIVTSGEKAVFPAFVAGPAANSIVLTVRDELGNERQLSTLLQADWAGARTAKVDLLLDQIPVFEPAAGDVSIRYRFTCPTVFKRAVTEHGKLTLMQYDVDGKLVRTSSAAVPASPFQRFVRFPFPGPQVKRLVAALRLHGRDLCPPIPIHLLAPGDHLAAFKQGDDQLRYAGGFAILRRPALDSQAPAPPAVPVTSILLIDDLIAATGHFADNLDPEAWFRQNSDVRLRHQPLEARSLAGAALPLRKFQAFKEILDAKLPAVIWAVGAGELAAGMDRRDFRAHWAFLIEACLRRDKLPILATPPIRGRLTQQKLRPYALVVKELAAKYSVPVVDFYSASLRRGGIDDFYWIDAARTIRSATPSADGRRWLLQQIGETLDELKESPLPAPRAAPAADHK